MPYEMRRLYFSEDEVTRAILAFNAQSRQKFLSPGSLAGIALRDDPSLGIEVELDTAPAHRGYGYATLAAAKLILTAHQQGKIATWDAANETSAHIAQKLGYRVTCAYQVFTTA